MLFASQFWPRRRIAGKKYLLDNQSGATAIEYSLIAALIAVSLYIALGVYYEALNNLFDVIISTMRNALG
jgi:Flp pilus assembly pilin Flp